MTSCPSLELIKLNFSVGICLQKFTQKSDFFHTINVEEFILLFGPVFKDATFVFNCLTTGRTISPLEIFCALYLLCDDRQPLWDKLDALVGLIQFVPVPDPSVHGFSFNYPKESVTTDDIRLLFDCTSLVLCRMAQSPEISNDSVASVADSLFDITLEDTFKWPRIKSNILSSSVIMKFIGNFIDVIFLPPILIDMERLDFLPQYTNTKRHIH